MRAPRPCSDWTELCVLVLASFPVQDASNLFEPARVRYARAWLAGSDAWPDPEASRALAHLYEASLPASRALHALPLLLPSLEAFAPLRARPFAEAAEALPRSPVVDSLRALPSALVELCWAELGLLAHGVRRWREREGLALAQSCCDGLAQWAPVLEEAMPEAREAQLEVSALLGTHGRGLGDRVLVGAPAPWHEGDVGNAAVWALHERAVQRSGAEHPRGTHARVELEALRSVARAVRERGTAELALAHARWLEALALEPLAQEAAREGLLTEQEREALRGDLTLFSPSPRSTSRFTTG